MRLQKSDSESGVDSRPFHFFSFDSDSALGLEELNPTPIPGGKWWSGVDSDSESRQNGVDSGFGVDSTGINYKSGTQLQRRRPGSDARNQEPNLGQAGESRR